MSYYQGDYYQGDYYQGDPFLGALIGMGASWLGKKLLGKGATAAGKVAIARTGAGALVGGGTGLAAGAVGGALAQQGAGALWSRLAGATPRIGLGIGSQYQPPMPTSTTMDLTMSGKSGSLCCPSGFHPNKSTGKGRQTMGMPPGSYCVRNRAMNVANPRALRRGLRRVAGFGKLASRARKTVNATARAMK